MGVGVEQHEGAGTRPQGSGIPGDLARGRGVGTSRAGPSDPHNKTRRCKRRPGTRKQRGYPGNHMCVSVPVALALGAAGFRGSVITG